MTENPYVWLEKKIYEAMVLAEADGVVLWDVDPYGDILSALGPYDDYFVGYGEEGYIPPRSDSYYTFEQATARAINIHNSE